ncbi:MAG: NADH-quinone oxidoreductase subunit NuoE, partial [Dehalococcoidia bacterium]
TNDCAMCTIAPRLVNIGRHPNIEILSYSEVIDVKGEPGNFMVTLRKKPRFINEDKCTGCGTCVANCPVTNKIYLDGAEKVEIKLEPEDLEKVKGVIEEYKGVQGALVPVLQDINAGYNYLPENVLRYISEELDIPLSLIYRVATFYNAFSLKPIGKYKITVCLGTTCHVKGAPRIVDTLERELGIKIGETTEDMNFTLETVNCVGCCGLAPVMTVGEDLYGKVTLAKIPKIIEQYTGIKVS